MNQRQIGAFRLVMHHGSITGAAQAMNVSQPAVSRLIMDLERSVGFPLLLRQGGRVRPTAEARELIQEVERMYYGLDRLQEVAREIKGLRRASLRIATMPMASFQIIPEVLKEFLAAHEGVRITHDVHSSSRIIELVSSRQVDIGIAQTHAERLDVDILYSFRCYCVCVMPPDHPLARHGVLTPRDLKDQPLVALAHHTVTAGYVTQCFAEAGIVPRIAVESQPSYSACGLAAIGVGIGIVDPITPRFFAERLRAIPLTPRIPFDIRILKPVDVPLSRAARDFLERTIAHFAAIGESLAMP